MEALSITELDAPKVRPTVSMDRFDAPDDDSLRLIRRFSQALDVFRTIDPKMPSSYVATFLAVAMKPGMGPTEYAKMTGTIQPIASRILLEIGIKARERDNPLGLVDRDADPNNLRQQRYFLTAKGRAVLRQITNLMEG